MCVNRNGATAPLTAWGGGPIMLGDSGKTEMQEVRHAMNPYVSMARRARDARRLWLQSNALGVALGAALMAGAVVMGLVF